MSANLQQFSELFTTLQTDVEDLFKQEKALRSSITTLTSQCKFLENKLQTTKIRVATLETEESELIKKIAALTPTIGASEHTYKDVLGKIARAQERLDILITTIEATKQTAVEDSQAQAAQKEAVGHAIAEQQSIVDELLLKKTRIQTLINDLNDRLEVREAEITTKLRYLQEQEVETDKKLAALTESIDRKQRTHDRFVADITEAQAQLPDLKAQHGIFRDYEVKARKKLEAREASILAREKQYEEAVARAKRPGGILDGINL